MVLLDLCGKRSFCTVVRLTFLVIMLVGLSASLGLKIALKYVADKIECKIIRRTSLLMVSTLVFS